MERNRSRGRQKCWLDAIKDDLRQWNLQAETWMEWMEETIENCKSHVLGVERDVDG